MNQGRFGDIDVVDDDEYNKHNVPSGLSKEFLNSFINYDGGSGGEGSVQQQPSECENNGGFGSDRSGHGHSVMQEKVAVAPAEKKKPLAKKQPRDACRREQMNGTSTCSQGANGGNGASRPKARNEVARPLKKLRAGRIRKAKRSGAPTKNDTKPAVQD
ncbi:hypothetical protein FGB62_18g215 [Gracilaria domingensis]|nr:hypothetical protein FGB62_18g215 [Gracilaria domingensis]